LVIVEDEILVSGAVLGLEAYVLVNITEKKYEKN